MESLTSGRPRIRALLLGLALFGSLVCLAFVSQARATGGLTLTGGLFMNDVTITSSCNPNGSTVSWRASQSGTLQNDLGTGSWQLSVDSTIGPLSGGLPASHAVGDVLSVDSFSLHLNGSNATVDVLLDGRFAPTEMRCDQFSDLDLSQAGDLFPSDWQSYTDATGHDIRGTLNVSYRAVIRPTTGQAVLEKGDMGVGCGDLALTSPTPVSQRVCGLSFAARSNQPLDSTPPVVTGVPDRPANGNGWYSADVTVDWQASDDSGSASDPANTLASLEGTHSYTSDPSCDAAGNCATGSITLSIDKTAPTASLTAPQDGALYTQGQVVNASYSCTDGLSGVASCQGPVANAAAIDTSNGLHTFTVTATDAAGNQKNSTATYTVVSQLSDSTTCNGYYTGNGKDVLVPAGAVCHLLPGTSVKHDVTVKSGGTLIASGVTVGHDLTMTGAGGSSICASNIGHDLAVKAGAAGSGTIVIGDTAAGCSAGNTVGHDLSVTGNADPVDVGNNSVGHDLTVQNNTGGTTVRNNSAGQSATCQGNNPQTGSGNTGGHSNTCPA